MTVKIAVTGTHSTGKTAFVNAVREELQGQGYRVAVVSDLGEEALSRVFPILYQHTRESTLWIMTTGIARELEAALTADVVLVDRPAPDALGYYRPALAYREEAAPEPAVAYLLAVAKHHSRTYDVMFSTQLDLAIPLGTSMPRDTDGRFRICRPKASGTPCTTWASRANRSRPRIKPVRSRWLSRSSTSERGLSSDSRT